MSRAIDFDPFVHPPLAAEQRERLRADGGAGPANRELTFDQFLDAINPLHHIPVVGTLYRELTGDTIDSSASMVGSMIYGGPLGMVAGLVNAVVAESSGSSLGEHALALVTGEAPAATLAERPSGAASGDPQSTALTGERPAAAASDDGPGDAPGDAVDDAAGDAAHAAPPAPALGPAVAAASPPRSGQLLEGDDALAALAADLRAAVGEGGKRPRDAEGRAEAEAGVLELAAAGGAASSSVPPPESFMPLPRSAFSGPRLASDIKAEHAHRPANLQPALFPASLSAAAAKARDEGRSGSDADGEAGPADARPTARGAGAVGASTARYDAPGGIAPSLVADPRFAPQAAPGSSFTQRMTEALNKYRALEDTPN